MSGGYHHLVGQRDVPNDLMKIYVDGSVDGDNVTDTTTQTINSSVDPYIGRNSASDAFQFLGIIDELRVSKTDRAAAWIKATYNTLWDTLLTYGSEETGGWTGKVMGVTNPAKIMGVAVADIKSVMGVV